MKTAEEKLQAIRRGLDEGKVVYITTYLKSWRWTPDKVKQAREYPFRVVGKSLYMRRGQTWDCADGCGIVIQKE